MDFIPFKLIPVSGYDDLTKTNEEFIQANEHVSWKKVNKTM
jgi:hypothetical protein